MGLNRERYMSHILPTALVILDGFGYRKNPDFNAIAHAHTPFLNMLYTKYPHAVLDAAGLSVGLPEGFIGNSEVGHLTIGAGRRVPQMITRINQIIHNGVFFANPLLHNCLNHFSGTVHIMGLLSDAGVHSHMDHLYAFIRVAHKYHVKKIVIHAFLDGRDSSPQSALHYLELLERHLPQEAIIGSIVGRFYAMDRDKNWPRTQKCYELLTRAQCHTAQGWRTALNHYYNNGINDEFIPPTQLSSTAIVQNGDGIILFNFRPDRARQLISAFTDETFNHFERAPIKLKFFMSASDLVPPIAIKNGLHEVLNRAGKTMFAIAETEKYAHVTYFFDGGHELRWDHQERVLIPSIKTKNYVEYPCMSAHAITDAVLYSMTTQCRDFYLINYANADMVGHSGNFEATVKAIECLDHELKCLFDTIITKLDGTLYITADHGNAEEKWDYAANQPRTAHTANPVPFIMVNRALENRVKKLALHELSDIAPFILTTLGLPLPVEMQR